jgi:hypothetical protein
MPESRIGPVIFDVGEVLIDESREYGTRTDSLGVPRHTFSAVIGAMIARGLDCRDNFQVLRPGSRRRGARAASSRGASRSHSPGEPSPTHVRVRETSETWA